MEDETLTVTPPVPPAPGADELRATLGALCEDEEDEMRDGWALGYGDDTPRTLPVVEEDVADRS